jgi:hypothetical protein
VRLDAEPGARTVAVTDLDSGSAAEPDLIPG